MQLDEETIKKILLYRNYKSLSDEDVKNAIEELSVINGMYKNKIKKYIAYIIRSIPSPNKNYILSFTHVRIGICTKFYLPVY